ncbi:hypothetical protein JZ751_018671 [Albula glossodonta]|uniref:Ig-like domain-containing protein n=1 Tax=Albula glossodonta TaxID=121402 RepID=A0A8T2MZP7_9TELE|nr:hypothetical protein JZ751_018671 [Albula glossodonta]
MDPFVAMTMMLLAEVQAELMQWSENNKVIIQSSEKGMKLTDRAFTGRVTMSNETGDLTISHLREEDSGRYVFSGFGSSGAFNPKEVELHVYERISKVQVDSQVKNSTNSSSCSVTLSCSVLGGSQVALFWSRDGQRIAKAENRTTLTVSPSREEFYSCTASNPVSSLTDRVTVPRCQTHVCELKVVLFSVGLVAMVSAVIAVNIRSALQENQNQTRTRSRTRSRAEWKS